MAEKIGVRKYPSFGVLSDLQARRIFGPEQQNRTIQREWLVSKLGGCCVRCGYDKDIRALALDHTAGDGAADRKRLGESSVIRYYYKHLAEAKEKLQVLCSNCNQIKNIEEKEHARFIRLEFRFPELWALGQEYKRIVASCAPAKSGEQINLPFLTPAPNVVQLMHAKRVEANKMFNL